MQPRLPGTERRNSTATIQGVTQAAKKFLPPQYYRRLVALLVTCSFVSLAVVIGMGLIILIGVNDSLSSKFLLWIYGGTNVIIGIGLPIYSQLKAYYPSESTRPYSGINLMDITCFFLLTVMAVGGATAAVNRELFIFGSIRTLLMRFSDFTTCKILKATTLGVQQMV